MKVKTKNHLKLVSLFIYETNKVLKSTANRSHIQKNRMIRIEQVMISKKSQQTLHWVYRVVSVANREKKNVKIKTIQKHNNNDEC